MQILGMSTKELNEFIDSLLEKNPFLKKQFTNPSYERQRTQSHDNEAYEDYINNRLASEESPRDRLLSQLKIHGLNKEALEIAEYLISEMDDSGYIRIDMEEAAEDLGVTPEALEKVILTIQEMEPAGIGARDLRECLEIQLVRSGKEGSLEYAIVSGYMNELAKNDIKNIAGALNVNERQAAAAIENIKKLEPRPASSILAKSADPITPDLIVRGSAKDVFLELNRETVPQLRLYNPYENKLEVIKDPQAKEFLRQNMTAAKGLIDNLKRREETMCRVTDYIVRFQKGPLFEGSAGGIKSLTMNKVAEDLNMHLSTISRAVSNKFIQIDDKVMPLKSLLSHAITKENGETTSKASVKARIKELIGAEDKKRPLSDDDTRKKLQLEGIVLSRRTITKYRESLKILPTYLRRKRN